MLRHDSRRYKALYFDMHIKDLEHYYSGKNPKSAYTKIKKFLKNHNFSHEQYSGYHSQNKITDLDVFDMVYKMNKEFPWLRFCMSRFEVTNIGGNYNLMEILSDETDIVLIEKE